MGQQSDISSCLRGQQALDESLGMLGKRRVVRNSSLNMPKHIYLLNMFDKEVRAAVTIQTAWRKFVVWKALQTEEQRRRWQSKCVLFAAMMHSSLSLTHTLSLSLSLLAHTPKPLPLPFLTGSTPKWPRLLPR
jgi:hypothetical protein